MHWLIYWLMCSDPKTDRLKAALNMLIAGAKHSIRFCVGTLWLMLFPLRFSHSQRAVNPSASPVNKKWTFRTYYWRRSLEYLQYRAAKATQRQVDISVRITVAATRPLLCFSDLLAALSLTSWAPHIFCKTTKQNKIHFTRMSKSHMISRDWMAFRLLSIALKIIYIYRTNL